MQVSPITYSELDAWSRLTGRHLAPWEVLTIRALDDLLLRQMGEAQKERANGGNS